MAPGLRLTPLPRRLQLQALDLSRSHLHLHPPRMLAENHQALKKQHMSADGAWLSLRETKKAFERQQEGEREGEGGRERNDGTRSLSKTYSSTNLLPSGCVTVFVPSGCASMMMPSEMVASIAHVKRTVRTDVTQLANEQKTNCKERRTGAERKK